MCMVDYNNKYGVCVCVLQWWTPWRLKSLTKRILLLTHWRGIFPSDGPEISNRVPRHDFIVFLRVMTTLMIKKMDDYIGDGVDWFMNCNVWRCTGIIRSIPRKCIHTTMTIEHIWTETKWMSFRRRHFQVHFREWKCLNSDYNFTEVCS